MQFIREKIKSQHKKTTDEPVLRIFKFVTKGSAEDA